MDTPAEALIGLAPQVRTPPPGLVPMAREIEPDDEVTTLPRASSMETPSVKLVPATLLVGCVVTASLVAVPARIDTLEEVPGFKPPLVALNV